MLEKFHHLLHNLIGISILVIRDLPNDFKLNKECFNQDEKLIIPARYWSLEHKEKLIVALVKIFTANMPLYLAYKHLLIGHDRYARLNNCCCSKLCNDSISLMQMYFQQNSNKSNNDSQDFENLPIELLRNISLFINLGGIHSLHVCFGSSNATPDHLTLNISHLLINVVANVRYISCFKQLLFLILNRIFTIFEDPCLAKL